ncbi:MAG: serine hydrolase [bacterium]
MRERIRMRLGTGLLLMSWLGAFSCGDDGGSQAGVQRELAYPDPEWRVDAPEAHGLDAGLLEAAAIYAQEKASDCLVITRHGAIVGEWYWNGWDAATEQNIYSVSKSVTNALVGIAQDRGQLDIRDAASAYIPEWAGTGSEEVTIRNLLSNDSGRYWDLMSDYGAMYLLAPDKTAYAIALGQQYEPGTYWEYNNAAIQSLERVLEVATGMDCAAYAADNLFEPLGMVSAYGRDAAGNPLVFSDVSASCRDLARFGYLYLRGGQWSQGRRIVSEDWVKESTEPSTVLNSSYGYLWWLNREGHWTTGSVPLRFEGDGKMMPGLPEEIFRASGAFDQIIFVDPAHEIVFTRLGGVRDLEQAIASDLPEQLGERIRAAVLD